MKNKKTHNIDTCTALRYFDQRTEQRRQEPSWRVIIQERRGDKVGIPNHCPRDIAPIKLNKYPVKSAQRPGRDNSNTAKRQTAEVTCM